MFVKFIYRSTSSKVIPASLRSMVIRLQLQRQHCHSGQTAEPAAALASVELHRHVAPMSISYMGCIYDASGLILRIVSFAMLLKPELWNYDAR